MPPRDTDDSGPEESTRGTTTESVETSNAGPRELAVDQLQEALAATETVEKQFHIREALQLLRIDER